MGSQKSMNVPIPIITGFQQIYREDSQNLSNDTFFKLPNTSAQSIFGTENYPDSGILLNCDDDDCTHGYGRNKEAFKALKKDDILQAYVSDHDFRSFNVRADDVDYNLCVFDV